jgi:hypothetical protein
MKRCLLILALTLGLQAGYLYAIEYTQKDRDLLVYMGLSTTITIAVLSYVMYRIHRIEDKADARTSDKVIIALRELAQKDVKMQRALKIVGLL